MNNSSNTTVIDLNDSIITQPKILVRHFGDYFESVYENNDLPRDGSFEFENSINAFNMCPC